jgi:3D (Asp-Asp-Asp) domain-containing protein
MNGMRQRMIGIAMMAALVSATDSLAHRLPLGAGAEVRVVATAYCQQGATESGAHTRDGIIGADPHVLEVGSLVRILDGSRRGIYTVLDTGATVKGFKIDIFIKDCGQARTFGKQPLRLRVLRRGPNSAFADEVPTVAHHPRINIIFRRTFLDAMCGLELALASQDSTCLSVTECFVAESRISMSRRVAGTTCSIQGSSRMRATAFTAAS